MSPQGTPGGTLRPGIPSKEPGEGVSRYLNGTAQTLLDPWGAQFEHKTIDTSYITPLHCELGASAQKAFPPGAT